MKSVKALLFVFMFSMVLLAGCAETDTDTEAPVDESNVEIETPAIDVETPDVEVE
jgi:PBP1b-binding outer membrane lipoprotein LpoB